ncbi:MAG TPA: hypothetical protein VMN78_00575 [Longimicrobiales bacterium]|nr:hypothetical protein [Longimicrobiales bacterium]
MKLPGRTLRTASRLALLCSITVLTGASAHHRPLPFFYDLYTFRGDDGGTDVVAAFAVVAGELETEEARGGVRYRFDVTLVLADTALHSVSRTDDSVFVDLPRRLDSDHLLHTHIEVRAAPSRTTLQRVIMSDATKPGIGQMYGGSFPIPDYSGSRLMLSDIALGQPDTRSGWRRGDVALALLPTSQFPASAFDVYYEIYNLTSGGSYTTAIAVERIDEPRARDDGDRRTTLRFFGESDSGADGALPELRRVEASLERGRYRLTATITDLATGESAARSRLFHVRGRERATTMVRALPREPILP